MIPVSMRQSAGMLSSQIFPNENSDRFRSVPLADAWVVALIREHPQDVIDTNQAVRVPYSPASFG
jgi:hypothetical protein